MVLQKEVVDSEHKEGSNMFPLTKLSTFSAFEQINSVIYRKYTQTIYSGDKIAIYGKVCGVGIEPILALTMNNVKTLGEQLKAITS